MKNTSLLILPALLIATSAFALPGQNWEADRFQSVAEKAQSIQAECGGSKNVLLIFDIDNTLLAPNRHFGSDQWFRWQADILAAKGKHPDDSCCKMVQDFGELVKLQGELFVENKMHPVDPETTTWVKKMQDQGFPIVVLTSRGSDMASVTLDQFKQSGFDFSRSSVGASDPGPYLPYDDLKDKKQRPVAFTDGVYLTAGQDKGEMLRALLARKNRNFSCLLFVDDRTKNIEDMKKSFDPDAAIKLWTVRFSREDGRVAEFEKDQSAEKKRALEAWQTFSKQKIDKTLPINKALEPAQKPCKEGVQ